MSDIPESPTTRPNPQSDPARTLELLATLFLVVFVVTTLYVGREILVPIAIAILLSFVLSPPILLLRRLGLGRVTAVLAVVLATIVVAFTIGAVLTRQVSELAVDLPKYQATVDEKFIKLRDAIADNALFAKVSAALKSIGEIHLNPQAASPASSDHQKNHLETAETRSRGNGEDGQQPIRVEVHQPDPGPFALVQTIAGTALSPVETTAIVMVYVVFILLQREDLRNRFIRLVGSNDLRRTTVAMSDAAGRLSRFFLAQTLINASFGLLVGIGLYYIGLPSPILWGAIAFVLRFIPYIGAFIAASFPILLAAAVDRAWGMSLETLALYLVLESIIGQVVEPWVYGHNTGLSPIAVVISATFWTWLWGTIGLVLSTPLTVCLVVLGRHVERLAFLDVIFGDAPPLTSVENFYQRMLVGDAAEVADQAELYLKNNSLIEYYDNVALPALLLAQMDLRRGVLDESGQHRIKETIEEVIDNLSEQIDPTPALPPPLQKTDPERPYSAAKSTPRAVTKPPEIAGARVPDMDRQNSVLCIAGRSPLDEAAAALFAAVLRDHGVTVKVEPAGALTISRISRLSSEGARIVCLSFFDADLSAAAARFAVRRLRRRLNLNEAQILAGFWQCDAGQVGALCVETKADACATTLKEALSFCVQDA